MNHSKSFKKKSQIKSSSKISLTEKIKNFFRNVIYYFGIVFSICVAIYSLYIAVPEILKIIRSYVIDLITKDYKNAPESVNIESANLIKDKKPQ